MTDGDGNFTINIKSYPATLTFSFLGMEADDLVVKSTDKDLVITMKEAGLSIEHTVITGYTQTSIKKITGSVGVLTSKSISEKANSSIDAMLQGQLAGVSVTATSGQPGRNQEIRIRGQSTLTGDASPLWVVADVSVSACFLDIDRSHFRWYNSLPFSHAAGCGISCPQSNRLSF